MRKIRLDNFFREYPGSDFPAYVSLSKDSCSEIAQSIRAKFEFTTGTDGLTLVRTIAALAKPCGTVSHAGETFNLCGLLKDCKINAADEVNVNWYRYDKIDRLKLSDLGSHFYDIWYPDVDDIDVFDDSLKWILSIRHDGCVKLLRRG